MRIFFLWWWLSVVANSIFVGDGSYNSFRNQTGFCKLQGFDTISRSTSNGPSVFTTSSSMIGVGLNRFQFQHNISNCGRCIEILSASNMGKLNHELDGFSYDKSSFPFYAIVMDECNDPVCTSGYLDFDIYTEDQPVAHGNPRDIHWRFVDCPPTNTTEFLFCFSNTCNPGGHGNGSADPYYWSVFIRNRVKPVVRVEVQPYGSFLRNREGWTWDDGEFAFHKPFRLILDGIETFHFDFSSTENTTRPDAYRGGILVIQKNPY